MIEFNAFLGLDVHQDSISVVMALPQGDVDFQTAIPYDEGLIRTYFEGLLKSYPLIQSC
ncbi:MAG: hypothetical protein KDC35_14150 [Acidobacteria bacterium]|nr:hypothetical protein [Acidobacteriota bacterium]